jgi:hypothetical protein
MTPEEAKAYLSFKNDQIDLEEHYEEFLFQQKDFFRQKPISYKLYNKHFLKIEQAIEAYETLGFISVKSNQTFKEVEFNQEIKQVFDLYHLSKNNLFQQLYSTENLSELILIGNNLLNIERQYKACFESVFLDDLKLTTPNPMEVLQDIKKLNEKGICFTYQIDSVEHSTFKYLLAEINRLKRLEM